MDRCNGLLLRLIECIESLKCEVKQKMKRRGGEVVVRKSLVSDRKEKIVYSLTFFNLLRNISVIVHGARGRTPRNAKRASIVALANLIQYSRTIISKELFRRSTQMAATDHV